MRLWDVLVVLHGLGMLPGPLEEKNPPSAKSRAVDDAMMAFFRFQKVQAWSAWGTERRVVACEQLICRLIGIDPGEIDGLKGPQTTHAFEVFDARRENNWQPVPSVETWRDEVDAATSPALPKANAWPRQDQAAMMKFFGPVGTNQVTLELPYPMRLAWDLNKVITRTQCHALVEDPIKQVLSRVLAKYGMTKIRELRLDLFGGLLNVRKKRGGSTWSMHAWGIALDIDPERNQLKWGRDRATLDGPEYDIWWDLWEEVGAVSLGRVRNFDWMHVQFARL